jgi:hypothetical protein
MTHPDSATALAQAWERHACAIDEIRRGLLALEWAREPAEQVRAQRLLLQAQAAAYNLVIAPDPRRPAFLLNTVFEPNLYTWLMPNPDCLYRYAFVDGARRFEIRGLAGRAPIVELQVIGGFWGDPDLKLLGSTDLGSVAPGSDGSFRLVVGPERPRPGEPWIQTDPSRVNTLLLREIFADWEAPGASKVRIEPLDDPPASEGPSAAALAARLDACARMIRFCLEAFSTGLTRRVLDAVGWNRFQLVDTSRDEDAANPAIGYVPAIYELGEGEALVVTVEPPEARYWNVHLGDLWWQVADFTQRQSSLNGGQVEPDADGRVRAVIAAEDPAVPNWLDPCGASRGVALVRWHTSRSAPVPSLERVPLARLREHLPAGTREVSRAERQEALRARREGVLRRYTP